MQCCGSAQGTLRPGREAQRRTQVGVDGRRTSPTAKVSGKRLWEGKRRQRSAASRFVLSDQPGGNYVAMASVRPGIADRPERGGATVVAARVRQLRRRREEAARAPSALQPQGGEGAQPVSRRAGETEGVGVPVSVRHLPDDVDDADDLRQHDVVHRIESVAGGALLDPGSASRRGRALILVVRRRESRARSQANGPGRGWTLQFSGLETLEKAGQRIQLFTNP